MKDLYYLLGTPNNASREEITDAYLKLVLRLQPNGPSADAYLNNHLDDIAEAYEVLSDPTRRRRFDHQLKKAQQRRLYYFKLRHINIAASLALLTFSGLFGWYVVQVLGGHKKPAALLTAAAITEPVPTLYKHKKHHHKTQLSAGSIPKQAPLIKKVARRPDTIAAVKPVAVQIAKAIQIVPKTDPVVSKPAIAIASTSDMAFIRTNVTGIANLHQSANLNSAVVGTVPNNAKVQVLERGDGFCKVMYNSQAGYVPKWTVKAD